MVNDLTMKAVLLQKDSAGHGRAVVEEVPRPEAGYGELVVEMKACGLCGTDIEKIRGEYTASMPVLGHEAVGVITSVGRGVAGFREGDRVFPHHHISCGSCHYCRKGNETMCAEFRRSNLDPGGFAEFFRVPMSNVSAGGVLRLPRGLGFELGALTEPVGCCIRGIDKTGVGRKDSVLVAGAGPVGMMHSLILNWMGAKVMVSDVSEPRLRFAEEAQVGNVIDARKSDVPRQAKELTGGRGPDLAIVASGSPKAIVQALGAVRKGGKVLLFGAPFKGSVLDYDISEAFNSELAILTSYGTTEKETRRALKLFGSGEIDFAPLITHRFPLADFDDAVEASMSGAAMKVLITP
jgi:L-iditol 2-dehydrogenase